MSAGEAAFLAGLDVPRRLAGLLGSVAFSSLKFKVFSRPAWSSVQSE